MFESSPLKSLTFVASILVTAACGNMEQTSSPDEREAPAAALKRGAVGAEVQRVHEYLVEYGYLPNATLQSRDFRWRARTNTLPSRPDMLDEASERALAALQTFAHIPATGAIDDATRGLISRPRCGVDDGYKSADPSEKWAVASRWPTGKVSWRLTGTDDGLTRTQLLNEIRSAMRRWSSETDLMFVEQTGSGAADIEISFAKFEEKKGEEGNTLAHAYFPADGGDMEFNTSVAWTENSFHGVFIHELGHALGIDHSSNDPDSIMWPWYDVNQEPPYLRYEDNSAISILYDTWSTLDGCASDIAGGNSNHWVVGCGDVGGGNSGVFRRGAGGWEQHATSATRISVSNLNLPWVVKADGSIERKLRDDTWESLPGCAIDVAVGRATPFEERDEAWVIGCGVEPGGRGIYHWNGSGWDQVPGGAVRIAIGPGVRPWIVNESNEIFRYTVAGDWELLPGRATDIGADGSYVWIAGVDGEAYVWNEQPVDTYSDGQQASPARSDWVVSRAKTGGAVTGVAVDGYSEIAWIIQGDGTIRKQSK